MELSGTAGVKRRRKVMSCCFVASNNDSVAVSSEFCIKTAVELDVLTVQLFVIELGPLKRLATFGGSI